MGLNDPPVTVQSTSTTNSVLVTDQNTQLWEVKMLVMQWQCNKV